MEKVANISSVSFKSVVPVRVYKNGVRVEDKKFIEKGLRLFRESISAVDEKFGSRDLEIMKKYSKVDPEYSLDRGIDADYYFDKIDGYLKKRSLAQSFRYYVDELGRAFFISGKDAERLENRGHQIGRSKKNNVNGDVNLAKMDFRETMVNVINTAKSRLTESFNPILKTKLGSPVVLDINLVDFKDKRTKTVISDINFSKIG